MKATDCRLCCGPHDDETHQVTESLHRYLREKIRLYLEPVVIGKRKVITPAGEIK